MTKKQQLVISGALVTKVTTEEGTGSDGSTWRRETQHGSVSLEDWLEQVLAARGTTTFNPQLSDGQIIARKTAGSKECVVVELKPAVRRIIERVSDRYNERARQLAFPYVYLVLNLTRGALEKMFVFYRNAPAEDLGAKLGCSNLPNVYGSGSVCTGSMSGMQPAWSLVTKVDWLVRGFWDSQFNRDLLDDNWRPSTRLAGHPQDFTEWEQMSQEDPRLILGITWRSAGKTIQQVLDEGVR